MNAPLVECDTCAFAFCFVDNGQTLMMSYGCPDDIVKTCPDFHPSRLQPSFKDPAFVYSVEGNHMVYGCKSQKCHADLKNNAHKPVIDVSFYWLKMFIYKYIKILDGQ